MSKAFRETNPEWITRLQKRVEKATKKKVAVGYPKGKARAYPDGTSVITVATANNYGLGTTKRAFMDQAAVEMREMFIWECRSAVPKIENGTLSEDAFLKEMGLKGVAITKRKITDGEFTPNKPATAKRKGSDRPLIDTGHMMQSTTFEVRNK